jgi:Na+/H+ antiporter NhaD/arsenite permease-like protein
MVMISPIVVISFMLVVFVLARARLNRTYQTTTDVDTRAKAYHDRRMFDLVIVIGISCLVLVLGLSMIHLL